MKKLWAVIAFLIAAMLPLSASALTGYLAIAPGAGFSAVVTDQGDLLAWGDNTHGQLGTGTTTATTRPKIVSAGYLSVAAGSQHTLGLKNDGSLWAWGYNASGQLGDGTTTQRLSPVQIGLDTSWRVVAASFSGNSSFGLKNDGSLWAWGVNNVGQLGDGSTTSHIAPVQIGSNYAWVAAGNQHAVAIRTDGSLWAWGSNSSGQLGDGTTTERHAPIRIGTDNDWFAVKAGATHTLALKGDGSLWAWGNNASGRLGDGSTTNRTRPVRIGTGYLAIAAGSDHSVALKSGGSLWAWGSNSYGQLGDGTTSGSLLPKQIGSDYTAIAAGIADTLAARSDGSLLAWGFNYLGQLGDNSATDRRSPVPVASPIISVSSTSLLFGTLYQGIGGSAVQQVNLSNLSTQTVGISFTISGDFRQTNTCGTSLAAGRNCYFLVEFVPTDIGTRTGSLSIVDSTIGMPRIVSLSGTGGPVAAFLRVTKGSGGTVTSTADPIYWYGGDLANSFGQKAVPLGTVETLVVIPNPGYMFAGWGGACTGMGACAPSISGDTDVSASFAPIAGSTSYAAMAAGDAHTLVVKTDGSLWGWGDNSFGQLGDGSSVSRNSPVRIGGGYAAVAAGGRHTLAVKQDGSLWAWGSNSNGQLGQGVAGDSLIPLQIGQDQDWQTVAAGQSHSLALKKDGTLWVWGANGLGQLGDATTVDRWAPLSRGAITYTMIAAGGNHTLVLGGDSSLFAWGSNSNGQLGNGSNSESPDGVSIGTGFAAIAAGRNHSLALKPDGSLWAWGANGSGQLGDASTDESWTPKQVGANYVAVAAGGNFSLGMQTDRSLWAWGDNGQGQLGNGSLGGSNPSPGLLGLAPEQIGTDIIALAAGGAHTLALTRSGDLWIWGANNVGQLGDGTSTDNAMPKVVAVTPVSVDTNELVFDAQLPGSKSKTHSVVLANTGSQVLNISAISVSGDFSQSNDCGNSLAVGARCTIGVIFGPTASGRLNGSLSITDVAGNSAQTVRLQGLGLSSGYAAVATAAQHVAALGIDGLLWMWGRNDNGQLGDGTTNARTAPVLVGSNFASVSTSETQTVALKKDGSLWVWGQTLGSTPDANSQYPWHNSPLPKQIDTGYAQASAGNGLSFGVKTDGSLWAWGISGGGDCAVRSWPSPFQIGTGYSSVSADKSDRERVAAVMADGSLWSWGNNLDGRVQSNAPLWICNPVSIGNGYRAVDVHYTGTYGIKSDYSLWGWGAGGWFGDGTAQDLYTTPPLYPVPVKLGDGYKMVSSFWSRTLAVRTDGSLWAWGLDVGNTPVQIGTSFKTVAAGQGFSIAIQEDGSLWAWGDNSYGQYGDAANSTSQVPVKLNFGAPAPLVQFQPASPSLPDTVQGTASSPLNLSLANTGNVPLNIAAITVNGDFSQTNDCGGSLAAGASCSINLVFSPTAVGQRSGALVLSGNAGIHTVQITGTGLPATFGLTVNNSGHGRITSVPAGIDCGATCNAGFANGGSVTLIATPDVGYRFAGWGGVCTGVLSCMVSMDGLKTVTANFVSNQTNAGFLAISAGMQHTAVVKHDGSLLTWGGNGAGQLGDGTTATRTTPQVIGMGYGSVAAGGYHSVAVASDGSLWAWGSNDNGQLGDGTTDSRSTPVRIGADKDWALVAAGHGHTLALKQDGSLWAWGSNVFGQVGDGTTINRSSPVQIGTGYAAVAAGASHTVALKSDGTVWGWGSNAYRQLGDNEGTDFSNADRLSPSRIGSGFMAVAAGEIHTIALRNDGGPVLLGPDYYWLGNPAQIGGAYSAVAAGSAHSVGLKTNGTLLAWGSNQYGQLGNGSTTDSVSPVTVGSGFVAAVAGYHHTVAVKTDGSLWLWGSDYVSSYDAFPQIIAPAMSPSPTSLDFGGQSYGNGGSAKTVSLSNTSTGDLRISAITVSGDFSQTNNCGTRLAAGASCSINVVFLPTALGNRTGSLSISYGADNSPHTVGLSGSTDPLTQAISFGSAPGLSYGGANATVSAAATSGLPVSLSSLTMGVCTISGTTVTPVAAGTCTIAANQAGNAVFSAAPQVTLDINVAKATPVITWANPAAIIYGTALGSAQLNASASVAGSFAYTPPAGSALNVGAGQTLSAQFTPTDSANYNSVTTNVSITVTALSQRITFGAVPTLLYGGASAIVSATATSGLPVTFTSMNPARCTVSGSTVTPLTAGNCIIAANQAGNSIYAAAPLELQSIPIMQAPVAITWANPAAISYGTALGSAQLKASASVPGTFVYSPAAGAVLDAGENQTLFVRFVPTDSANYLAPSATVSITVNRADQSISFISPPSLSVGDNSVPISVSVSSGLPQRMVPLTSLTPSVCTVNLLGVSALKSGLCTIAANQAGTSNYAPAPQATLDIPVAKSTPGIYWPNPATIVYGTPLSATQLNAKARATQSIYSIDIDGAYVYSPSEGSVLAKGVQSLSVQFTPTDSANFNSSTASASITVNAASQNISFGAAPSLTYGGANGTLSATATSGLPVVFTSLTTTICSVSGNMVSPLKAGTCTIAANQAGNSNYAAAPQSYLDIDITYAAVATGGSHTCALTAAGGVQCWGYNGNGQLGNGSNTDSATPVGVSGLTSGVTAIAAGGSHTCALSAAGGVQCWGYNGDGQLGNGSNTDSTTPVVVSGLTSGVTAITAGGSHTCALFAAGGMLCWGNNAQGQLGNGTYPNSTTPVAVSGLTSRVTAIAAGGYHTCSLTAAGGVQCWGTNSYGQLGNGTLTNSTTPVVVTGLASGVTAISAGNGQTCALTSAGSVQCWGYTGWTTVDHWSWGSSWTEDIYGYNKVPAAVFPGGVVAISSANSSLKNCALFATGQVQCWLGAGYRYDMGNSSYQSPTVISGLASSASAVSAGGSHSCARIASGAVECWGSNWTGQLGNGTTSDSSSPVQVLGLGGVGVLNLISDVQSIGFANLGNQTLGAAPFSVTASASSGLPVDFSSLTPTVCAVSGNTVSLVASGTCTMAADQPGNSFYAAAPQVTRSFLVLHSYGLTVANGGNGGVVSSPSGIDCGASCNAAFADGTVVTLSATPNAGYVFSAWGGACSGSGICTVTLSEARSVSASFALAVPATGVGTASASPVSLGFGSQTQGVSSAAQTVMLSNTGTGGLSISSVVASGEFSVSSNTCGTSLAAGATCTIGVSFTPTATGNRSGVLTITDNAANNPHTVSLSGSGTPVVVSGTVMLGPVIPGNGLVVNLYQANGTTLLGSGPLDVKGRFSISVGGYVGVVIARLVDTTPDVASYMDEATGQPRALTANLMSVGVAAGGTVSLNVNPLTTVAALKLGADTPGANPSAALVTQTNAAVAHAFGLSDLLDTTPVSTVGADGNKNPAYGTGATEAEKYGAVLAALSGMDQGAGPQATIATLTANLEVNGDSGKLNATALNGVMAGALAADANTHVGLVASLSNATAVTSPSVSIAIVAGDNVISAWETGSSITGTNDAGATVTLSLGGNVRVATVAGTTWSYALQAADISAMGQGVELLTATAILNGGATANATRNIVVDTLAAVLSAQSVTFSGQTLGSTSPSATVTFSNRSMGSLAISSITTTGDFGQSNTCGASLAAGTSCDIAVNFTPTAIGTRTGSLTLTDIAGVQVIQLSGSGNATTYTLTVSRNGSGTVTSDPDGINCGAICTYIFNAGTPLTLTAFAGNGYSLTGWGGACGDSGTCSLTMSADRAVSANFGPSIPPVGAITANLVTGWNLIGNGTGGTVDVAGTFGNAARVLSVWKWQTGAHAGWAYYSPSPADGGAAYADGKGYAALSTINPGEGFWVNAVTAFSAKLGSGSLLPLAGLKDGSAAGGANVLPSGWSLLAVGNGGMPRDFVNGISKSAPLGSSVAAASINSLWAWHPGDATHSAGWIFYSPSLDNSAGLATYNAGKGYYNFSDIPKTLDPAIGFWVNHP